MPRDNSLASLARNDAAAPAARDHLDRLNPEQRQAVEHGGAAADGGEPLVVIAGAGSGKTSTLACRVAHLVCGGADPQRILLLTFSRRAAAALERRAGEVMRRALRLTATRPPPSLAWAGTFHSVGARLLREYAQRIGLADSFTIHDRSDSEDLLAIVRNEQGLSTARSRFPGKSTCLAIYSRVVNAQQSLDEVLSTGFPWCAHWEDELKKLFRAYTEAKQAQHTLDYDDLLLYWAQAVADPRLANEMGARFDHVLVDEYQDTNRLQAQILLALKPDGRGVTVVGDDAQAIYSFRAATVRNILDFPRQFSRPARVVALERNYRSTQAILDASNAVIGLASERFTKNLWTERKAGGKPRLVVVPDEAEQARYVAERVLEQHEAGVLLRSQAVLFRSSSHSAPLEIELARRGVPFVKYGGLKFLEAAHVKDLLCVLRWAENPRSRMAAFRVVRLLPGIGAATAARLLEAIAASPDPAGAMPAFAVPPAATEDWQALMRLMLQLRGRQSPWPAEMERVARWYAPHLERLYEDAPARQKDIAQLQQLAATYPSRERFLTELTLDPPEASSGEAGAPDRDEDYLVLSTIHSAKGQEWKSVCVLNVVDGCIPSDMATATGEEIEEERRLLYVAMTRAKDDLRLIMPQRFYVHAQAAHGDRHVYALRSRFIPESIVRWFDPCVWPEANGDLAARGPGRTERPAIDIAARVRALWS